jgi:hypothetical protein
MMSDVIRLYGLFFVINLALVVIALIDCLSAEEYAIRALPRWAWVLIILLFSPVGAIVCFVAGRPQTHRVGPGGLAPGSPSPSGHVPSRPTTRSSSVTWTPTAATTSGCFATGRRTCAGARRS